MQQTFTICNIASSSYRKMVLFVDTTVIPGINAEVL